MQLNLRAILRALSYIIGIVALALVPSVLCALNYQEYLPLKGLAATLALALFLTLAFRFLSRGRSSSTLRVRDGYLTVSLAWFLCSLVGALPYLLSGESVGFMDALFESTSGFTTTGATVLSDWDLPRSIILWRATTNWLGGLAILVFIISVLPRFGAGGHRVATAETSWSSYSSTSPRVSDLSRLLSLIYFGLTAVSFAALSLSEMGLFEALINSLGGVSTAGLLLHPGGVAYYDSLYVELVISLVSLLASINFVLYLFLIQRNFRDIRANVEIRYFLAILGGATLLIAINLWASGTFATLWESFRSAAFQVVSVGTTSGYTIGDPNVWPEFSKALLFALFFVGGCSASTAGSIKVIRIVIMFKLVYRGFVKRLHPHAISSVKMGKKNIPAPMVTSVVAFISLYILTYLIAALGLSLQNLDFETTLSAAGGLLSNTGFAFGQVVDCNFGVFSNAFVKGWMCLVMIVGRLELYSVLLLFIPSFWNPDRANLS
jgi:trk system potassium uptake protein TrkH